MKGLKHILLFIGFLLFASVIAAQEAKITGRIFDARNNDPVPFANIIISGTSIGSTSDLDGNFVFTGLEPGFVKLVATAVGYERKITEEIQINPAKAAFIDIAMPPASIQLDEIVVKAATYQRNAESPVSLRTIGVSEIEKNPGANRDISRVVQSLPGVATTPAFRNDIIVRGGGPSENTFFLDDVEIPTLNHFSTQGASGGPVGIVNADFLLEVDLISGAFPASRGNMLSSVIEMKMKNGNRDKLNLKGTVGASDLALTLEGPIGEKSTFIFSARRSYLQLLFSALKLPFLPTYNDFQLKNRIIFDPKNTLTFIGIGAIDQFKLNTGLKNPTEDQQYILDQVPVNNQWSYTFGAVYKHFANRGSHTLVASRNYLDNRQYKYSENDESSPANKIFDYKSTEAENKLRYEYDMGFGSYGVKFGGGLNYAVYTNQTFRKDFSEELGPVNINYNSNIDMLSYSLFAQVSRSFINNRLALSLGVRTDANNYSARMSNMLDQLSPRLAASFLITDRWSVNFNTGRYFQRPAYTTLGYRNNDGELVNKTNGVKYIYNDQVVAGFAYRPNDNFEASIEGFYKYYYDYPFSLRDSISLASKGADYGTYGDEAVVSDNEGRAAGAELFLRGRITKDINILMSYTYVRSEFRDKNMEFVPSAWDNKHLFNISARKSFKRNWDMGAKWRFVGGAPYTPWDLGTSENVLAWQAKSGPYLEYDQFNAFRLKSFHQLDVRVDKSYYFRKWSLTLYLDIQNLYNFKAELPENIIRATDENGKPIIVNPEAPIDEQRYELRRINNEAGTVLPTIGIIIEI
ncbi:MAG: TonB-dependent receptor [Bacteroidales bacterium]|nr:TonB-dependent receptor [Bacteroidales bacterium]